MNAEAVARVQKQMHDEIKRAVTKACKMHDFEANWQPIETAPTEKGDMFLAIGHFVGSTDEVVDRSKRVILVVNRSYDGGEKFYVEGCDSYPSWLVEATHWMPLPEPPESI